MNLRKKGFSLIELLVVIAVIGILAGIAFPVFARAKDSAYRSSDISRMNEIRTALQLYRTDQGAYPPALLGYATGYMDNGSPGNPFPTEANIVPAEQAVSALFPKRVSSLQTFQPSYIRPQSPRLSTEFTTAVWPVGVDTGMGAGQPNQRFGPETVANRCVNGEVAPRYFYRLSGYDAAPERNGASSQQVTLRYSLFWSGWTTPADPCNPNPLTEMGSGQDNPRQLGYSEPPDSTVVTWNSYFREYEANGTPRPGKRDVVLFLGGSARTYDSIAVANRAWRVEP
jgi:prepilin-type N-terminal cleavage/methylation domain-containing protein